MQTDMKNSTQKSIKWLSIAILLFATVYIAFIYYGTINQIWIQKAVVWNQDMLVWQYFIIAGRFIGATLLYVFCVIFLIRTNRFAGLYKMAYLTAKDSSLAI